MPPPIIAHAADYVTLIPIPIAVIALLVYSRRQRRREDQPLDTEPEGLAAIADATLLGLRSLRDRYRRGPRDGPKQS